MTARRHPLRAVRIALQALGLRWRIARLQRQRELLTLQHRGALLACRRATLDMATLQYRLAELEQQR